MKETTQAAPALVHIRVQEADFNLGEEYARLVEAHAGQCGAVALFVGRVRDWQPVDPLNTLTRTPNTIQTLTLTHYPEMTEKTLYALAEEACQRWSLLGINVVHRVGTLIPSDQIVLVGVASAHREAAFAACEMLMDYLKTQAPFWKKTADAQSESWVDAKAQDAQRAKRWDKTA